MDERRLIDTDSQGYEDGASRDLEVAAAVSRRRAGGNQSENGLAQADGEADTPAPIKHTSQLAALFITVNVTVGVGLLAMPYTLQLSGLIPSLLIQFIFLITIVTTTIICTELTVKTGVDSYHKVVQAHCHPYVYQFTQATILLIVFGTTVAFIVIVGDQADRVFASLYGPTFCHTWYMDRRFIMSTVVMFFMIPLCCSKTVDFLKYASFLGVASLGFIMYLVTSEFIKKDKVASDVNFLPKKWTDMGAILPVLCMAYQCHLSWVPTAATIRKEEKYTTYKTITFAMIVASIIYGVTCILAVLTFGSKVASDLTESYPGKSWAVVTTIAIVAVKCIVTLPPAFLPARLSIIDILSYQFKSFHDLSEAKKRIGVTFITITFALLLAAFVPDILVAVDILGSMSVMFIFTLPGLCYLNLIRENRLMKQQLAGMQDEEPVYSLKDKVKRAISFFFIIFGSLMVIVVLYKSIQKIVADNPAVPLCHS